MFDFLFFLKKLNFFNMSIIYVLEYENCCFKIRKIDEILVGFGKMDVWVFIYEWFVLDWFISNRFIIEDIF